LPKSPHNRSKDPAAEAACARRRRGRPRVLTANEPRAYCEGIAAVISQLRPEVEIETVEPNSVDTSIERFSPDMVICSKATDALEGGVRV
jgi:DNA-binding transcriptional LysR family regulator